VPSDRILFAIVQPGFDELFGVMFSPFDLSEPPVKDDSKEGERAEPLDDGKLSTARIRSRKPGTRVTGNSLPDLCNPSVSATFEICMLSILIPSCVKCGV